MGTMQMAHNESIMVALPDIKETMQCPICLGIIRKTRAVMECLHRFCRACINKSMRLGRNECPSCRAHCAGRRALRADPKFDALIAALYPDLDKYEHQEFSMQESDAQQNRKIQASIAGTARRQLAATLEQRCAAWDLSIVDRRGPGPIRLTPRGAGGNERGRGGEDEERGKGDVVRREEEDEEEQEKKMGVGEEEEETEVEGWKGMGEREEKQSEEWGGGEGEGDEQEENDATDWRARKEWRVLAGKRA
eukprot:jgi/Mesen1/1634/ME000135S00626